MLARLILDGPNVLVLDEPTNHLDIPSRTALEGALAAYPGTLITVSHDRFFLDRIATRIIALGDETPDVFMGNYSAAMERLESRKRETDSVRKPRSKKKNKKARVKSTTEKSQRSVEIVEADLMKAETDHEALLAKMAVPEVYGDPSLIAEYNDRLSQIKSRVKELEEEWESLT